MSDENDYSVAEDSIKITRGKRGKYNWEVKVSLPWNIAASNLALRDKIISDRNQKLLEAVKTIFSKNDTTPSEVLKDFPPVPSEVEFGFAKGVYDSLKTETGDSAGIGWTIRVSLPWNVFFNDMDLRDAILLKRLVRLDSDQRRLTIVS